MQQEKRGRGCLFYGCITLVVVIVALFVGTYFGTRKAFKTVLASYTDPNPIEIPRLSLSPEERDRRLEAVRIHFHEAMERGGTNIALDETDLNLLILNTPDLQKFSDQIFFLMETNKLKARVSLPLDQFEVWRTVANRFGTTGFTGRYLNATLVLTPGVENNNLHLELEDVQVRGASLPETFTGRVELEKLTEEATRDPASREVLGRIESIDLTNNQVLIHFRNNPAAPRPL